MQFATFLSLHQWPRYRYERALFFGADIDSFRPDHVVLGSYMSEMQYSKFLSSWDFEGTNDYLITQR